MSSDDQGGREASHELRDGAGAARSRELRISSRDELLAYLEEELHYCGCAYYEEAVLDLRDVLRVLKQRKEASARDDADAYARLSMELAEVAALEEAPGLGTWFLYLLEARDLIGHASNVLDAWIEPRGEHVLRALEAFWPADEPGKPPDAAQ